MGFMTVELPVGFASDITSGIASGITSGITSGLPVGLPVTLPVELNLQRSITDLIIQHHIHLAIQAWGLAGVAVVLKAHQ